ncbi:hypothetical protein HA49_17915 [Tatumella morbirosei]|uniref:Uncharacterized protein n=1 Tax=Tatumella morbirosei TaxID=642227 RepID=A0A095T7F4_9GAMM|nr:hypothetical protein [Tatumella morbirosei]KGD72577.1 hypothetical protein HA49_17915 [Tatumella morbirosei]
MKQAAESLKNQIRDKPGEGTTSSIANAVINGLAYTGDAALGSVDYAADAAMALAFCTAGDSYCVTALNDLAGIILPGKKVPGVVKEVDPNLEIATGQAVGTSLARSNSETVDPAYRNNQVKPGESLQNQAWLLHVHLSVESARCLNKIPARSPKRKNSRCLRRMEGQVVKPCVQARAID